MNFTIYPPRVNLHGSLVIDLARGTWRARDRRNLCVFIVHLSAAQLSVRRRSTGAELNRTELRLLRAQEFFFFFFFHSADEIRLCPIAGRHGDEKSQERAGGLSPSGQGAREGI